MSSSGPTDAAGALPAPGPRRAGRTVTLSEALDTIRDGMRTYFAPICSVPTSLLDAMADQHDRWSSLTLCTDYLIEPVAPFRHAGAPFQLLSLQPTPATDAMRAAGALRTVSASYGQFARLLEPGGPIAVDAVLVQVSPPGPEGRFSLGVGAGVTADLVRRAPLVIAEINPAMPYTFGASECERHEFDLLVEVEHPLVELVVPAGDDIALAIGAHAAAQVPDGATLEFGIGAIPEAVLAALHGRVDLGLHGGMISDAVVDLAASGALSGARKSLDAGFHCSAGVVGTAKAFAWVDRNPDVYLVDSRYSHGVTVLARQERFTAINSAIEVACDGSVNAEVAGTRIISGPGGQPDFAIGASLAPQGISLLTLRSTAAGGKVSRIVDRLPETSPTTVSRYLVDRVVTEFGVAELKGRTPEQRRDALRAVAHPDHRADL